MNWDNVVRFSKFMSVFLDTKQVSDFLSSFVTTKSSDVIDTLKLFQDLHSAYITLDYLKEETFEEIKPLKYIAHVQRYALMVLKKYNNLTEGENDYIARLHTDMMIFSKHYVSLWENPIVWRALRESIEKYTPSEFREIYLKVLDAEGQTNLRSQLIAKLPKETRRSLFKVLDEIHDFAAKNWNDRTIDKIKEYLKKENSPLKLLKDEQTSLIALLDILSYISLLNYEEFKKLYVKSVIKITKLNQIVEFLFSARKLLKRINVKQRTIDEEEEWMELKYLPFIREKEDEDEDEEEKTFDIKVINKSGLGLIPHNLENLLELINTLQSRLVYKDVEKLVKSVFIVNALKEFEVDIHKKVSIYNINVVPFLLGDKSMTSLFNRTTAILTKEKIKKIAANMISNALFNAVIKEQNKEEIVLKDKIAGKLKDSFRNLILTNSELEEKIIQSVKNELKNRRIDDKLIEELKSKNIDSELLEQLRGMKIDDKLIENLKKEKIDNKLIEELRSKMIDDKLLNEVFKQAYLVDVDEEDKDFKKDFEFVIEIELSNKINISLPFTFAINVYSNPSKLNVKFKEALPGWLIPLNQFSSAVRIIEEYIEDHVYRILIRIIKDEAKKLLEKHRGEKVKKITFNTLHPFAFTLDDKLLIRVSSLEELIAIIGLIIGERKDVKRKSVKRKDVKHEDVKYAIDFEYDKEKLFMTIRIQYYEKGEV